METKNTFELSLDELESEELAELPTREALSRHRAFHVQHIEIVQIALAFGYGASASNTAVVVASNG
jgi:hypothetical protein